MLSRDFSSLTNSQCQIQHKTLPPQIEFAQLSKTNTLNPVHYLVKHEEILPTQKNDSHLILADFGDDHYSLRIQDSGNKIIYSPITPFSFKSIVPFNSKYKKPLKKQIKSLLQQNPLLNESDLNENPDTIDKRIPSSLTPDLHINQILSSNCSSSLTQLITPDIINNIFHSFQNFSSNAITIPPSKSNTIFSFL